MKLYLFDVDNTLAQVHSVALLPGVQEAVATLPVDAAVALCTNQGGVGLRYWMESGGFGDPSRYETLEGVQAKIFRIRDQLFERARVYISWRYQSRKGHWSTVPPGLENDPAWSKAWRKPNPGMLLQAMRDTGVAPADTLFVGDSEKRDQQAAWAAGCGFMWADEFRRKGIGNA